MIPTLGHRHSHLCTCLSIIIMLQEILINTLRPRQNGRHFADDILNRIFVNENVRVSTKFSLKFIPKGPINNIPALVQIMAWRRLGDKPLSEPMMDSLPTHICVTRPQWVKVIHIIGPELRKFDQKRLRILKSYIYTFMAHRHYRAPWHTPQCIFFYNS